MKRRIMIMTALILAVILCVGTALSDTLYVRSGTEASVSLRDVNTNEVLCTVPAGVALQPDGGKSTELFAYVTYGGYSGYVLWSSLSRNAAETGTQTSQAPTGAGTDETESCTLKTTGAYIQEAATNNRGKGQKMTEMKVTKESNVIVSANIPRGSKLDYWVINGVRYDFLRSVKWMRITNFDRSWYIEAVSTKEKAETLRSEEEIQAGRTGAELVAQVKNGELCHIREGTQGGGGWITSFDFTADYNNRATGIQEKGGQLTAKIRARIPKGKRVAGWKLEETKFYFPAAVGDFVVRTLDTSMTYEPIFGIQTVKEPAAPSMTESEPEPDPPSRQQPVGTNWVTHLDDH